MLELEQRTGSWTPMIEDNDDYGIVPIARIGTGENLRWVAANPPLELPFSTARRIATEYAKHAAEAQHSAVRDRVFIGCVATHETIAVIATS